MFRIILIFICVIAFFSVNMGSYLSMAKERSCTECSCDANCDCTGCTCEGNECDCDDCDCDDCDCDCED